MIAARLLALLLLVASAAPAAAQERILSFISDVVVARNGDLDVTETIRVQAELREIRRGILRDFPTSYRRSDGSRVEVGFEVQSVTRNGAPETYALERLSNGTRIRIGSADRFLTRGPHDYVIRYRTTRQIGFFQGYDELYWNATGTGWTFAIDQAEARITLPDRVPFRQTAVYTGPQGATGRDAQVVSQEPGRIVFRTTRPLPPRNGLTVAASWEKGLIAEPTAMDHAGYWLADNLPLPVALLGLVAVLGYYFWSWLRVGRDPRRGTIIPLFGPPPGMSAAAVRFVERMGFDHKCFTAAIIELGVNGHLQLKEIGGTTDVIKRDGGKPMPSAEEAMKRALFDKRASLPLVRSNHSYLGRARGALERGLVSAYQDKLFRNNYGASAIGILIAVAAIAATIVSLFVTRVAEDAAGLAFGALFPLPFVLAGTAVFRMAGEGLFSAGRFVGLIFIVIPAVFCLVFIGTFASSWVDMVAAALPYLYVPLIIVAFAWMKAPTKEGRRVMDQIEGFRRYLGVAEEDRLEALNPPEKTPELFERFLPYAIALDVENTWARRFAGVLAAAGTAAAAGGAWYAGSQSLANNPTGFAQHLGSDLSQTIAAASTPPGSSGGSSSGGGSSGGGSSGGGGGGGGGSGW